MTDSWIQVGDGNTVWADDTRGDRPPILLCPRIPGYEIDEDPDLPAEIEKAVAAGPDAVAELGLRLWARAGRTPEVVEQLRSAARAWISEDEYGQPDPPVFDRLGQISVPSSLLIGDLDRDWIIKCGRLAAAAIPGCLLVEVEGVDHLPPLRVPDRVLELIRQTVPA